MPTISGLRRRGYTPNSIKNFISKVGVAKRDNVIDVSLLEFCVREDLNKSSTRAMAVLNPVLLKIVNYPKNKEEELFFVDNPESEKPNTRPLTFNSELYIEKEDFSADPPLGFKRLSIGSEVRLKSGYIVKATHVELDSSGNLIAICCKYDPKSLSGSGSVESQRKVNTTIHWVCKKTALSAEVREYERLFTSPSPDSDPNIPFESFINKNSLQIRKAFVEPFLSSAKPADKFQFQRLGYFNTDDNSSASQLIFNKTVSLREQKIKKPRPQTAKETPELKPIEAIKKLGKKYAKLSSDKQSVVKQQVLSLSQNITLKDLAPLFSTAIKKRGTRGVVLISLSSLKSRGVSFSEDAKGFVTKALDDQEQWIKELSNNLL
jgi:glutaminyl-tRNA synthetase